MEIQQDCKALLQLFNENEVEYVIVGAFSLAYHGVIRYTGDHVIQLGVPPVRVDLITALTGVGWEEVSAGSMKGNYGDLPISFIGKEQLIKNIKSTGRIKTWPILKTSKGSDLLFLELACRLAG